MAHLALLLDGRPLLEYRLSLGRTTIGRADTCDIALPGAEISRTHCFIDGDEHGWRIVDRSRHGITVDGAALRRGPLKDGSTIVMGPYTAVLRTAAQDAPPTAEAVGDRSHEQILATDDGHLLVERTVLAVIEGPDAGRRFDLRSARTTIGAPPSGVPLSDPTLEPHHVCVRMARGRLMVEPGAGAAWLDGARVREITPVYVDEELALGHTVLRVEVSADEEQPQASRFGDMVGDSPAMRQLFGTLRRFAGHHFPVLLTGESGTGKELAAHGVHHHSSRAAGPFVPLNCGAIAENLFESELFGHVRGAFTGADRDKPGAFHRAERGTLFLDEVGELPLDAQAKLLRALESGEVRRVGDTAVSFPDVRVVAATNRDLAAEVRRGAFREDLYYRLAVLSARIPPLRDRLEDVPLLARTLARGLHPQARVSQPAMDLLQRHPWPGNVRELRNVLTRAFVMAGPSIEPAALSFHHLGPDTPRPTVAPPPQAEGAGPSSLGGLEDAERRYIIGVLASHDGNRSAAARALGIARGTLLHKMRKLGIQ